MQDSLKSLSGQDSLQAEVLFDLQYLWAEYNFDSSWHYMQRAEKLAYHLDDHYLIRKSINAKGIAHDYQNQFDSAIFYYQLAGEYAREHNDLRGQASSIFNLGVMHSFKGEMELAIEKYQEAGDIYEQIGDQKNLALLKNNLGIIYRKTGKYEMAGRAYQESLAIKRELGDELGVLNTLTNLSPVLRSLALYDSAIATSKEVLKMAKRLENREIYLHELVSMAEVYSSLDNHSQAVLLYQEAEQMLSPKTPYETSSHVLLSLAQYHLDRGNLKSTKRYLDRMSEFFEPEARVEIAFNYFYISYQFEEKSGNTAKALDFLKRAYEKKIDLTDQEILYKTTELEQLYEKEKRELQIETLNAENQLQSMSIAQKEQERNGLILLVALVMVVAGLMFVLYRQNRKSLRERETLLREIHHRVKNNLQVISSLLKLQAGSLSDEAAIDAVREGEARVKSMALIHQRLYSASDVRGVDIQEYLQNLVREIFHAFGVDSEQISLTIKANFKLDIDTVIPLGLIINELITNSIKYAFDNENGGALSIEMVETDNTLIVSLRDSGKGMELSDMEKVNSFGWKMIKSLSRKLKAEISITNVSGTHVQLAISRYKLVA